MVKRNLRKLLALLMCCAMLTSNLSFAGLAEDAPVAPAEPAAVELPAEEPAPEPAPEAVEPEATEPDTTEPETTEPETTEPEATEPEATEPEAEPEAEAPEATEPEVAEPEAAEPEATETEDFEPGGGSEPEVIEPEVIAPEPGDDEGVEPAEEAEPALDIAEDVDPGSCDHIWNEAGTECEKCGVSSGDCSHPSAGWEDNPYWRVTDPNDPEHAPQKLNGLQHRAYGGAVKYKYCGDCGLEWRFTVTDPQGLHWITENHSYVDDESGQRMCWVCGYVNTCDHEGTAVVRDEWFDGEYESVSNDEHRFTGTRYRVYDCTACGDSWNEQVEGTFTEGHDLNADGIHCSKCDYTFEGCNHPEDRRQTLEYYEVDIEQYPDGSHVISSDENGCKVHARWVSVYECDQCGMRWNHQVLEPDAIRDDEHEWGQDENGNLSCNFCGRKNECQHDNAEKTGDGFSRYDDDFDDEGEYADENGHAVLGDYWENFHCNDCGADYQIREENHLQEGWHEWDDEKRGSICRICGYDNPCQHPNPEPREYHDANYGVYSPEDIVVSFNAEGHELHTVTFRDMWCPICDANWDGVIADSDSTHWYDHEWNDEGTACEVCGYESECNHEGTTEEVEPWEEPDWDIIESKRVVRSNATSCEVYVRCVSEYHCTKCDMHWGWHIINDGYTRVGDHEWNYDNGAGNCVWCNAENPCDHHDVEIYNEGFQTDTEYFEKGSPTADHCDVICHYWADMHCNICGEDFHMDDFEYSYQGEHIWNDEDGKTCELCGWENECQHENAQRDVWWETDWDLEEPIVDVNDETHSVYMRQIEMWNCEDCGLGWGWHVISEEDEFHENEPHKWNYDDGGWECTVCGWGNPCGHENAEYVWDWYDLTEESEVEYQDEGWHVISHTNHNTRMYCPTCDAEIIFREEDVNWEGEHEWDSENEGKTCWACGWENPCNHPETMVHTNEWWELAEGEEITATNANTHTGMFQHVQETRCDQCGASWDWKITDGPTRMTQEHQWYFDEVQETVLCEVCGYESSCAHSRSVLNWEEYDYENATVSKTTATTHKLKNVYVVREFYCEDCGVDYRTREKLSAALTGEHEWDDGNEGKTCWICGYANPCKHPSEKVAFETWWDTDTSRGGVTEMTATEHTRYVMNVGEFHCYACDARWGRQEMGPEEDPKTEPHEWNDEGFCNVCGYENSCAHENAETWNDWYSDYSVVKSDGFSGHSGTANHYQEKYCPDCDFGWIECIEENVPASGGHEWDSEDGGKTCQICGFTNLCKHPASMVQTDTWDELDAENYPNEGMISSSASGCTVHMRTVQESWCEQCGARYGWKVVKTWTRSGEHVWNGDEAGNNCIYCHWENECTHDGEDQIKVLDEWLEDVLDDGDPEKFGHDENEHWYQATVYQWVLCEQCGAEFRVEAGEETRREGHDWQPDEDGKQLACWLCGEVNTCEHKHLNLNPHSWYESCPEKGGITKSDAKGHTGWVLECQGYYCPDCDATVNATYTPKKVTSQPHDWSYDENGAFCVLCGYANSCTHPDAECWNEWFNVYEDDERNETADDYHILYGDHFMEMHCPKCNADYIVVDENVRNFGMHVWEWDSERNESFCYLCGMHNICGHENVDLQSWIETDWEKRDEIVRNAKTCTVPLIQVNQKYCLDCDAEIERTETPLEETRTGAHEWNGDGVCRYCDWENTCTSHKSTVKYSYDSYPEKLQIISSSAIGHKVVLVTYNINVCSVCGMDLGETVKSDSSKQVTLPHSFDENGVCGICGWKNACEHPNATRREFTAPYGDQIVSSNANGHVVYGQKYSMMRCDTCGAYWDYQQIEAGVQIEAEHEWDSAKGKVCIDCGYKNPCTHPKASKSTQTMDYTQVVVALTNDATHTIAKETDSYTYCSACGAKFGYAPTMTSVTEAHKMEDGACTVCGYSGDVRVDVESLSFAEEGGKITLGVGEKYTPQLVKGPANATTKITYKGGKSGSTTVFKVNADTGEITAKAEGKNVKLTASADGVEGVESATLTITVKKKPTSIALSTKKLTLGMGDSAALKATLSSGSAGHISWTSSDPSVAEYDEESGKVVTHDIGTAIITATVYSGKTASCTVTVLDAPNEDNMELTLSKEVLGEGETATATLTYDNAAGAYEITSDDPNTVSVTKKGDSYTIKGVKPGKATITARCTYNDAEVSQEIEVFDAPTTLMILNKISPMGVGEPKTVDVSLGRSDSKPCAGTVTFSSSDTSVLAVNKTTGKLTAKKAGTATITAQSYVSKVKATVKVTVKKAPTSIKLSATTLRLGAGETDKLTATLSSGSAGYVSWYVDNPDVVDFHSGTLEAIEPGVATITARVYNSKDAEHPLTAICTVLVGEAPTEDNMCLALPKSTLSKGDTMTADFWYEGGAQGAYKFSVSDTSKATIDQNGKIKAKAASGTVTVTVTAYNDAKVTREFTLAPAPTQVSGVPSKLTLTPEEVYEFINPVLVPATAVSDLSVTSSNKKVAEVWLHFNEDDEFDGYAIHALKTGTATITVSTYKSGISATCTVTVKKSPTSLTLKKHELEMVFDGEGSKYTTAATTLKTTLKPTDCGGTVEWRSSNESVATVDAKGKVTPVGLGRTTITASITNFETGETFEDYCEVRVYAAPKAGTDDEPGNIRLQPVKSTIGVKESTKLEIVYIGSSGAVKANSYKVVDSKTDGAIVTVDKATGKITAKKAGTANVQVTMFNGEVLTTQITVVPAPGKVQIVEWTEEGPVDVTKKTLAKNEEYQIEYQLLPQDGKDECEGSVTFSSSDAKVAKVDKNGLVTALKKGTATITIKTQNNKTDTLKITVS